MATERANLSFRKNCEGYFTDRKGNVLAKVSEQGIVMFPGGGIDEGEHVEQGMLRETFEETGAIIQSLTPLGDVKMVWGSDWAKTEKQKKRYEQFQGDHMHFFSGVVEKFSQDELKEEDSWDGNKFIKIEEAIQAIKLQLDPSDKDMYEYRQSQIRFLEGMKSE